MVIKTESSDHTWTTWRTCNRPSQESPEVLNSTYVECHRRTQALKTLGENIDVYGRVLAPKVLRAFPADVSLFTRRGKAFRKAASRNLWKFLNEEVAGALNAQKIRGESSLATTYVPTAAALQVNTKLRKSKRQTKRRPEAFCEAWAQDCQQITETKERIKKIEGNQQVLPLP
jgi:hypothetical protein